MNIITLSATLSMSATMWVDIITILSFERDDHRLTKNVIKKLLPDSLGNFSELLPILDIGEALNSGAYLTALERTRVGEKHISECQDIEKWMDLIEEKKEDLLTEIEKQ